MVQPPPLPPSDEKPDLQDFLWASLQDNQATLRSIDGKLNAMLLVQVAPIPLMAGTYKFSAIWTAKIGLPLYLVLCSLIGIVWAVALYHLFSGIHARFVPADFRVDAKRKPKGVLFPGDSYLGENCLRLQDFLRDLPCSHEEIREELAFEVLKVSHIRLKKVHHQRWAMGLTACWIVMAALALGTYGQFLFGAGH